MKKQSAPSAVVKFAAARSRIDPLEGTTWDAIADAPKKTHPARFTAAILHSRSRRPACWRALLATR